MSTVISVRNISKSYRLGLISRGALADDLQRLWARVRGLPDPLQKIDQAGMRSRQGELLWALKDISFDVQQGEVLGIIGRNGAGKSTLLKILSRVTAPTTGDIKVKGRIASLLEVGTGFHPELTGRENVFLNGAILGMKKAEISRKFDEIVDFSGVEKFINTPVKRYSSGMYVRLAFAVAAHLDPEILIVDEVLAVGDIEFQKKCMGKMSQVARDGRTVLFVSHNIGAIVRLCSRGILLNQGKISIAADIETTVKSYIAMGNLQRAEYTQPADSEKPINLRGIYLTTQNGNLQSQFKYTEGFRVNIQYEVNQPIKNCSVWIGFRTLDDFIIFGTSDTDLSADLWEGRKVGIYNTSVTIPGNWLNDGNYHIVVGISSAISKQVYDRVEAIECTILDDGTPEKMRTGYSRPGVLQPFLTWDTRSQGINPGD